MRKTKASLQNILLTKIMYLIPKNVDLYVEQMVSMENWSRGELMLDVIDFIPFCITLRPKLTDLFLEFIVRLVESFPEDKAAWMKEELLKKMIHGEMSEDMLERYCTIVYFLRIAIDRSFLAVFDVGNRVYDVMVSKPKKIRVLTEFFFWFAPEFGELSFSFVSQLRKYVEIERVGRTLPERYKEVIHEYDALMQSGWNIKISRNQETCALRRAVRADSVELMKTALPNGHKGYTRVHVEPFDTHWMLFYSPTLLHYCAYFGARQCVRYLVDRNSKVPVLDGKGRSVADLATLGGHSGMDGVGAYTATFVYDIVTFHLKPISSEGEFDRQTLLRLAIKTCNYVIFFNCLSDLSALNEEHVRLAITSGSRLSMWMIRRAGKMNLNQLVDGTSLLHLAIRTHQPRVVEQLVAKAVDVNLANGEGKTPLELAVEVVDARCVEILVKCPRTDVNVRGRCGISVMHDAILRGGIDVVERIVACGSFDVNCRDDNGSTPLHYSMRNVNAMGTHVVVDGDIANQSMARDAHYIRNYGKFVHVYIIKALLSCHKLEINVYDKFGVFVLFIWLLFITRRDMAASTSLQCWIPCAVISTRISLH